MEQFKKSVLTDQMNPIFYCNLTPKGHALRFVIPKLLEVRKSFYMFYKMEEGGESNMLNEMILISSSQRPSG